VKDWEKEEQLQKTFESIIQKMQVSKPIMETTPRSQPPMWESFGPLNIGIDFFYDGEIIDN